MKNIKLLTPLINTLRAIAVISGTCLLISCGGSSGAGGGTSTGSTSQSLNSDTTYTVTYAVTGSTSRADLTYACGSGCTSQETVNLPWKKDFKMKKGDYLYISAYIRKDSGSIGNNESINADIRVNGISFKSDSSIGDYVIVTASGTCC